MTFRRSLLVLALLSVSALLIGQEVLTNESVVKLVKAGLGDDVIVSMVTAQPGKYSTTPDDIIALKKAGASDRVIGVMLNHSKELPAQAAPPAAPPPDLFLHDATPVRLRLARNLSSADATTGETIEFEVLDEVTVDGVVVVARGEKAIATVTEAEHKKRMARGGKLDVALDYVRMVNGDKVALRAVEKKAGGGPTGGMTAGIVVTALVVWPAAPFFLFIHGKEATIPKGTEIMAYTDGEIKLDRQKFIVAK